MHQSATTLKLNIVLVCFRPPPICSNLSGNEQEASQVVLFVLGYWKQIFQVGLGIIWAGCLGPPLCLNKCWGSAITGAKFFHSIVNKFFYGLTVADCICKIMREKSNSFTYDWSELPLCRLRHCWLPGLEDASLLEASQRVFHLSQTTVNVASLQKQSLEIIPKQIKWYTRRAKTKKALYL